MTDPHVQEMTHLFVETRQGVICFGETEAARRVAALKRAAFAFVAGATILTALLLPDWVGRYQEQDPTGGALFAGAIAGVAALVAGALGLSRWLRAEHWEIDPSAATITFVRKLKGRPPSRESVRFDEVAALEPDRDAGRLTMHLREQETEVPMLQGVTAEDLGAVVARIREATQGRRHALTVRTSPDD